MDTGPTYEVKDIRLAEQGRLNIELAEQEMGALLKIRARFQKEQPLQGVRVGMALHLTKETAALIRTLAAGGADVAITGCNPLSAQDDVCAALAADGAKIWGYKGEAKEDYYRYLQRVIAFKPHITIDDGCDLVTEIHTKHPELLPGIWGGCEETTTGIIRLRAMEKEGLLKYPIIAVNDNKTKHLRDNFYGTGQSSLDGILRATHLLFAGKIVVVAGYGSCGKGVALRARGMGAEVIVTEVDPFRALQARMDGHRVMPMADAARIGDVFLTVTGNKGILRKEHFPLLKHGAILANAGHFDVEIDLKALEQMAAKRRVRASLDEYTLNGKRVYVVAEGRLVNLAAAEGHPALVMAMSFCGQSLAVEHLVKNRGKLPAQVITLPGEIDTMISRLQLEEMGIRFDQLTKEQEHYLQEWREGT
ncbi:MAG: adenosylhomocysteinase [Candidatus Aenigmarchaeota archaeon]|nr:adenosylhomocysteinase [Candidatus Aenigmarchaeota archaeon]